jgi:hypothetical protein
VDGRDIIVHARAGSCPIGRYEVPAGPEKLAYVTGLGDLIALLARRFRINRFAKLFERVTGKSCGCRRRQEKLNRLLPTIDEKAMTGDLRSRI